MIGLEPEQMAVPAISSPISSKNGDAKNPSSSWFRDAFIASVK
jgi:hypothetical protein